MPFSESKAIIFRIVPNSGGNDLPTLRREFSEANLARIMAKLAIGQRLGQDEEFMGKGTPECWAQPYERLLLLEYVLEHEQVGQSLQNLLTHVIQELGNVQRSIYTFTYKKDLAKIILGVLPDLLIQLNGLIGDASLTVLCVIRELCDGFEILQANANQYPQWMTADFLTVEVRTYLATLSQFQIQLEQRIAALSADNVIQPAVPLELVPAPQLVEPSAELMQQDSVESPADSWSFQQAASQLLAYSFGMSQNFFASLPVKQLVTLVYMFTSLAEWWQPASASDAAAEQPLLMLDAQPAIDATAATQEASELVAQDNQPVVQDNEPAFENEVPDERPELSQILRDLRRLQRQSPTLAIRIAACEQLCRALAVIHAEASEQRKPELRSWQTSILTCLERYRQLDQNQRDTLEEIDQSMRSSAIRHTEALRQAYRGRYDNHFEKLCSRLFNFIKQVFQCSTLAKVQRLNSRCTMFAQAGGVPVGAPSLSRSDSRISLLSSL